jgi:hypothetical protein
LDGARLIVNVRERVAHESPPRTGPRYDPVYVNETIPMAVLAHALVHEKA